MCIAIILLIGILVGILAITVLVIVVPEEGIGIFLAARSDKRYIESTFQRRSILLLQAVQLTEPVFMACYAALIEVRQLTLLLCGHQLCCERQADNIPARIVMQCIALRLTLIPHAVVRVEGVSNRCIELLLVYQVVVGQSLIAIIRLVYQMATNACG